jgi:uncharacterized protein (DUF952 family)
MSHIYHMTSKAEWDLQKDKPFSAPSLDSEGFIHASHADQIVDTANRMFSGRDDLVILVIDTARLTSPLKVEDSYGHGSFPHVYGTIDAEAIVSAVYFPCSTDGTFILPSGIAQEPL